MVKNSLVLIAIVGWVASGAFGAPGITVLAPVNGGTTTADTTAATSISEDGQYVGGQTVDTDGKISAGIYSVASGTWTTLPRVDTGLTNPALSGTVTGVAHRSGGSLFAAGNFYDNNVRANPLVYNSEYIGLYKGSTGLSSRFGTSTAVPASDMMAGNANFQTYPAPSGQATASFADGSDAWVVGFHSKGTNRAGPEAYIWKASNPATEYASAVGRSGSNLWLLGVSSSGRAVGYDQPSGVRQGVYVDAGPGGTMTVNPVAHVPNWNSATSNITWGISDNGNYITGFQVTTVTTRVQGYVWKVGDATATLLPGLDGTVNNPTQQSYCGDVADDGTVVGYTYAAASTPATANAAIWFPGAPRAYKLYDVAKFLGIDMTGWSAVSWLGNAASSITKVGDEYYVTGTGIYNGVSRGWLLIVPEPATLTLLAFGGLMLRRRPAAR